jgi:hypothetical protein
VNRDPANTLHVNHVNAEKREHERRKGAQEHGDVMRAIRPSYSESSEEFGSQEHSAVMDAILGRGNY